MPLQCRIFLQFGFRTCKSLISIMILHIRRAWNDCCIPEIIPVAKGSPPLRRDCRSAVKRGLIGYVVGHYETDHKIWYLTCAFRAVPPRPMPLKPSSPGPRSASHVEIDIEGCLARIAEKHPPAAGRPFYSMKWLEFNFKHYYS